MPLNASGAPDLRLGLENRPENVALVRQALGGVAGAVRLDDAMLADVKTAVSEACNNVVVHAYGGGRGPMEVYVCPDSHELTVIVRDEGEGIQPRPVEPDAGMQGVGLSLIQALTKSVQFIGGVGEGTEVRMTFEAPEELDLGGVEHVEGRNGDAPEPPSGDIRLSVCGLITGPVLSSVVAMLAARAGFSVERLSDAQILSDPTAAHGPPWGAGRPGPRAIDAEERELQRRAGPLVEGGGRSRVAASGVAGLEPLLERLADDVAVEPVARGSEELRLALRESA